MGRGERRRDNMHLCATILSTLILEKRIDRKKIPKFTDGNSTTTHLCKHHFIYNTYLLPQNPAMELQNQEFFVHFMAQSRTVQLCLKQLREENLA